VASMDGARTIRRELSTEIPVAAITEDTLRLAAQLGEAVAQLMIDDGADLLPPGPARGNT